MLASTEQPLLACLAPVFPVVRRLVVGADILSYLAISASWPPLTQNDVGGKDSRSIPFLSFIELIFA